MQKDLQSNLHIQKDCERGLQSFFLAIGRKVYYNTHKKEVIHMDTCRLLIPNLTMAEEIRAYRQAFLDSGDSMDGTGGLRRHENPADWIDENERFMKRETVPKGKVPATQFVYVRERDGKIVGMIQVRHEFNDDLAKYGGHIGYSVRPDERRRGYASRMLQEVLPYCRTLGLDKVMVTCLTDNEGSRRTILKNGGVYEYTVHEPEENVDLERYWITL